VVGLGTSASSPLFDSCCFAEVLSSFAKRASAFLMSICLFLSFLSVFVLGLRVTLVLFCTQEAPVLPPIEQCFELAAEENAKLLRAAEQNAKLFRVYGTTRRLLQLQGFKKPLHSTFDQLNDGGWDHFLPWRYARWQSGVVQVIVFRFFIRRRLFLRVWRKVGIHTAA